MPSPDDEDAARVLRLCAACMYCDGLCPVYPALSRMAGDKPSDQDYLANLCHNCRACFYDCQYAPPHPFDVNAPAVLARVRRESYAKNVWPRALRHCFERPALGAALMLAVAALTLVALAVLRGKTLFAAHTGPGAFYAAAPWGLMAGLAAVSLAWAISSTLVSTLRFWRSISQDIAAGALAPALWRTLADIVTLRHLDGGGPGCHDSNEDFSQKRRFFHQIMAGGVLAAFAATLAAAFWEHAFGLKPPFALASAPVLLGIAGGVAIVAGAGGLLAIEARADRDPSERGETQMNVIFLIALELVTLSGLALLVWRETAAMGPLLAVHLALVTGFFAGLPASKAFHAPFRAAALLRNALDGKRAPRRKAASPE